MAYRTTAESLKQHKFLFETKTAPYDDSKRFGLLVQNVEGLISREHSDWTKYVTQQKATTGPGKKK